MSGCCGNVICLPVPPCPPPAQVPPPGLTGPIRGVTTGAPAAPGMVGEFIQRSVAGTVTVGANTYTLITVTPLQLGPGDWDVDAKLDASVGFSGAQFLLNPTIPGMSSDMHTAAPLPASTTPLVNGSIVALRSQLLTASAATILQFDITILNSSGSPVTGSYTFTVNARRMR